MKRYNNLYQKICNIENIKTSYNEICLNTKNKNRVAKLRDYKSIYITQIHNILSSKTYTVGPYNKFVIYEPKKRDIVSQNVTDKIINHLVARFILYPAILPCLIDSNVASRKNMGTHKGLSYSTIFKNKNNFLFLGRNTHNKYARYRNVKRKIKSKFYLYDNNKISLNSMCSTLICYKNLFKPHTS